MTFEVDRLLQPLRLAAGSHKPDSGKGCAMNLISYIIGDVEITDYPACSARPLARLVQLLNDKLAGPDGFLSPENSVLVLDLGWLTIGTADTSHLVVWRWVAELLIDGEHGVVGYAGADGAVAIRRVAALCLREAAGDSVSRLEWSEACKAAYAAAAADAAADAYAYAYADAAAYTAAAADAAADADAAAAAAEEAAAYTTADAAAEAAAAAYAAYAYAYTAAYADFSRWAITRWRELAGLSMPADIDTADINHALDQVNRCSVS